MLDPAIHQFFAERKEGWLKKQNKSSDDAETQQARQQTCEELFALAQWLPDAAKRAGQIKIATHPCTFSHPSARSNKNGSATPIIAKAISEPDGFLRSGNVAAKQDALGNAAALDVYKFLTLTFADGRTLLQHIETDSEQAKALLTIPTASYEELKNGFLAMVDSYHSETITSSKIKQVYFPVADDYHQLSILTPSGIMFELRQRLDRIRFSEETKLARDKARKNEFFEHGFREIYNLTTIGYGGTKPQNISVLNNQNGGKAHLLLSAPPSLQNRTARFPTRDFFKQSISTKSCKNNFEALHKIYRNDAANNKRIRQARDRHYLAILDMVIERMWQVRNAAAEQYHAKTSQLPAAQTAWLTANQTDSDDQAWLDDIIKSIVRFILAGYESTIGKEKIALGDTERASLIKLINDHREALL